MHKKSRILLAAVLLAFLPASFAFEPNPVHDYEEIVENPEARYHAEQMRDTYVSSKNGDIIRSYGNYFDDRLTDSVGNIYDPIGDGDYVDQNGRMATLDGEGGFLFLPQ